MLEFTSQRSNLIDYYVLGQFFQFHEKKMYPKIWFMRITIVRLAHLLFINLVIKGCFTKGYIASSRPIRDTLGSTQGFHVEIRVISLQKLKKHIWGMRYISINFIKGPLDLHFGPENVQTAQKSVFPFKNGG